LKRKTSSSREKAGGERLIFLGSGKGTMPRGRAPLTKKGENEGGTIRREPKEGGYFIERGKGRKDLPRPGEHFLP